MLSPDFVTGEVEEGVSIGGYKWEPSLLQPTGVVSRRWRNGQGEKNGKALKL